MLDKWEENYRDVAAIITAMTDDERPFLFETVKVVLADKGISQAILCIEQNNAWVDSVLGILVEDPRLQIIRMPLAFPGAVRNRALNYVNMPWVAYCDGDDVWYIDKILAQRSWADTRKCNFVGADHCLINRDNQVCAFAFSRYIPMHSSWLVRTEIMKQYPFSESLPSGVDGEWWVRTKNVVYKSRCPKILLKYRVRFGSVSSNTPSGLRKARILRLASLPICKEMVLFLTQCIWLATRREDYIWLKTWGQH